MIMSEVSVKKTLIFLDNIFIYNNDEKAERKKKMKGYPEIDHHHHHNHHHDKVSSCIMASLKILNSK